MIIHFTQLVFINKFHLIITFFIFRLMQQMYFFHKNGKTIDLYYPTIWLASIDYYPWNGYTWYGGRTPSSRMPKKSRFKLWQYQIIMYGCIKIKRFSTWSSKYGYYNVNTWLTFYGNLNWKSPSCKITLSLTHAKNVVISKIMYKL